MRTSLLALTLAGASLLTACPDPGGQFDAFAERTVEQRTIGGIGSGTLADVTGGFLLGLSSSSLPTKPLQFYAVTELTIGATGGTLSTTFYPLMTWFNAANRIPVGDPIVPPAADAATDGTFLMDLTGVTMDGRANAISGATLEADIMLDGVITGVDNFCGNVTGEVTAPAPLDLTGSFFGAIRVSATTDPPDSTLEASLPKLTYDNGTLVVCPLGETLAQIDSDADDLRDDWVCMTCEEPGAALTIDLAGGTCAATGGDVPALVTDTTLISCAQTGP